MADNVRLYFIIWILVTLALAIGGAIIFNAHEFFLLSTRGISTEGRVTRTEPTNHNSVYYSYLVGQQAFEGGGFAGNIDRKIEDIRIGDKVPITYDPMNPESSCLGDAYDKLKSSIYGIIFLSLFPTLALLVHFLKKDISGKGQSP